MRKRNFISVIVLAVLFSSAMCKKEAVIDEQDLKPIERVTVSGKEDPNRPSGGSSSSSSGEPTKPEDTSTINEEIFKNFPISVKEEDKTLNLEANQTYSIDVSIEPYDYDSISKYDLFSKIKYEILQGADKIELKKENSNISVTAWQSGDAKIKITYGTQEIEINISIAEVVISAETGTEAGKDWIDLGTKVRWATCNVGANQPQEYGDYFAWGETQTKSQYGYNYKFLDENKQAGYENYFFKKYQLDDNWHTYSSYVIWYNNEKNFIGDNKNTLEPEDDAAKANWGGKWRMPTIDEMQDLIEKCYAEFTYNYKNSNVKGLILYKKKSSGTYNINKDSHIFLPSADKYSYYSRMNEYFNPDYDYTNGYYFTSQIQNQTSSAYALKFEMYDENGTLPKEKATLTTNVTDRDISRFDGLSVRPVCDKD